MGLRHPVRPLSAPATAEGRPIAVGDRVRWTTSETVASRLARAGVTVMGPAGANDPIVEDHHGMVLHVEGEWAEVGTGRRGRDATFRLPVTELHRGRWKVSWVDD